MKPQTSSHLPDPDGTDRDPGRQPALTRAERLDRLPFTRRHAKLLVGSGVGWALDAMDVGLISFVMVAVAAHWDLASSTTGWIASVGFIGMARDEKTHEPVPYLEALPEDLTGRTVFLVDPMLATGGSLIHALRLLAGRGATDITVVCMVSAVPGVETVRDSGLPVGRLITATIDPGLNEDAYIVPGLGDAGDRQFGPR